MTIKTSPAMNSVLAALKNDYFIGRKRNGTFACENPDVKVSRETIAALIARDLVRMVVLKSGSRVVRTEAGKAYELPAPAPVDDSLPSSFDLVFDIKSRADLVEKMKEATNFLNEARNMLHSHNLALTADEEKTIKKNA